MGTNEEFAANLSSRAIAIVSSSLANDAEFLAQEIERQGLPVSGPQALRMFAEGVRKATKLKSGFTETGIER